jgi:hypothetical protein
MDSRHYIATIFITLGTAAPSAGAFTFAMPSSSDEHLEHEVEEDAHYGAVEDAEGCGLLEEGGVWVARNPHTGCVVAYVLEGCKEERVQGGPQLRLERMGWWGRLTLLCCTGLVRFGLGLPAGLLHPE